MFVHSFMSVECSVHEAEFDPAFLSDIIATSHAAVCIQVTLQHPVHTPDSDYPFPCTTVWPTF